MMQICRERQTTVLKLLLGKPRLPRSFSEGQGSLTRGRDKPAASGLSFSWIVFTVKIILTAFRLQTTARNRNCNQHMKNSILSPYYLCPFPSHTENTVAVSNYTDRCSPCTFPENHILFKCLTGRRMSRPSRLIHLSMPIIIPLKADEMRSRHEVPWLSCNLELWNCKRGRTIQHRTWNWGALLLVHGSTSMCHSQVWSLILMLNLNQSDRLRSPRKDLWL